MTLELKAGTRLHSAVCTTQVVVVRAPGVPVDLRCGGRPLLVAADEASSGEPETGFDEGTLLGKRYTDEHESLELLCTKAGAGSLSIGDVVLQRSGAKPLPASD